MGRRKKAVKKVVKKKKYVVAKIFKCLFCNHDSSVHCNLDVRTMTGSLKCTVCDAKFQTKITSLTEPIDVFTEWLDEASNLQAGNMMKASQNQDSLVGIGDNDEDGDQDDGQPSHIDDFDED